jgi:hypothetical protein
MPGGFIALIAGRRNESASKHLTDEAVPQLAVKCFRGCHPASLRIGATPMAGGGHIAPRHQASSLRGEKAVVLQPQKKTAKRSPLRRSKEKPT